MPKLQADCYSFELLHRDRVQCLVLVRALMPSIIVPFFADQPFWGHRVAQLGVGPAPIPRAQLTAERLAAAIETAVTSQPMRQRAAELGAKIRAEAGVANAVTIVQKWAQRL